MSVRTNIIGISIITALVAVCAAPAAAQSAAAQSAPAQAGQSAAEETKSGDQAQSSSQSDDELFGEETVTEASKEASEPSKGFIKYDQTKVGGSITATMDYTAVYMNSASAIDDPSYYYLSPVATGKVTLSAKPSTDFGVNMDFRMSYPYYSNYSYLTGATYYPALQKLITTGSTLSVPDFQVWALYSKFSVGDALFMSFGKQPVAWGVARGFFQPADNVFAESAVDLDDYSAEREGPIAFKAMYTIPHTMTNFYLIAGLPSSAADNPKPEDLRFAAKAEFNAGNTEFAFAGFYGYNDHARALAMATTGIGSFNFFAEAIGKYGSERYFYSADTGVWAQRDDQLYFSGTAGGYYSGLDGDLTILAQYYYNGEGQEGASAQDIYSHYMLKNSEIDGLNLRTHYAGLSISRSELFTSDFSVGLYAIADLSDLSGIVVPSATYAFTDYFKIKLQAAFNFGDAGTEYILMGPDFKYLSKSGASSFAGEPGVALSLFATLGSGNF